jgi:hypothetical protein
VTGHCGRFAFDDCEIRILGKLDESGNLMRLAPQTLSTDMPDTSPERDISGNSLRTDLVAVKE